MRTGNPVLQESMFGELNVPSYASLGATERSDTMTIRGTAIKAGVLLALCSISAVVAWSLISSNQQLLGPIALGGAVVGLITCLIVCFAKKTAPFVSPIYAIAEGAFIGAISLLFANMKLKNGLTLGSEGVFQAVFMTFGVFASMLLLYAGRILRGDGVFAKVVMVGTAGIALTYFVTMILRLCGMPVPFIHSSSPIGIGFSVVVVCLASFNLIIDFQFIENGSKAGAPKYMEWYGAFGLLVTLVWLYLEILRLLSKLKNR
jgi:uncharacterized YccA/Bax inhibitor family protein